MMTPCGENSAGSCRKIAIPFKPDPMEKFSCNLVICGLVRNAEENLQRNLARLDVLRPCFRSFRVVIYENDSTDRTKEILAEYAATRENVSVSIADYNENPLAGGPFSLHRIDLMARFRNQYLEKLREYPDTDFVAVIDLDVYHFSTDDFLNRFRETGSWDMVSAFGSNYVDYSFRPVFYDIYAYVPREESPMLELYFQNFSDFKKQQRKLYIAFSRATEPVPVNSNFNALAIYRYDCLTCGVEYGSAPCTMEGIGSYCEHVVFNKRLMEKGYQRLYLDPSLRVVYEKPVLWKHYRRYTEYRLLSSMRWVYGKLRTVFGAGAGR